MIETLESILVPGGRCRISPYVEEAQLEVLFGETPDYTDRQNRIRRILRDKNSVLQDLADTYVKFSASGRRFEQDTYSTTEFLKLYLAYYFTTNLSKIQLCLLDLVRDNKLTSTLQVVDIGVGAGTTAVAVLDFLLVWATTCHLYGRSFPVKSVAIRCHDRSPVCLSTAKSVTQAFCNSISRRRQSVFGQKMMASIMDKVLSWGQQVEWLQSDISQAPVNHTEGKAVLLFASNVLNELPPAGEENLAKTIAGMPAGGIATLIEPGDQASCKHLNRWKTELLAGGHNIVPICPCDEIIHREASVACNRCWNSRRESLHEPVLFRGLRKLISERIGDQRGFDDYSNNLLSWSYAVLEKRTEVSNTTARPAGEWLHTRVMGTMRRVDNEWRAAEADPDAPFEPDWVEFIKLCPAAASRDGVLDLWAKRSPGFILPPLRHGTPVSIRRRDMQPERRGAWIVNLRTGTEFNWQREQLGIKSAFLPEYNKQSREAIDEIAYRLFGFKTMRPFQHEILARVLTGKNILGIAATGGGKSECYILPAMLFPGTTVVVSPLKSLMQDQYEKRIDEKYGLRNLTTCINGDVPFSERQARLKRIELGYYKLVYFTPEQLRKTHVLNSLKRANDRIGIRYLALDEAHCISQWGHDFRDSYLNLVTRLTKAGIQPVRIALTATASPEVRADLCEELELINAPLASGGDVYVHSSNRSELNLIVRPVSSAEEKVKDIVDRLQAFMRDNAHAKSPDAAIVFMPHTGTDPNSPSWYMPAKGESAGKGRLSAGVINFASYLERTLKTRVTIYQSKMDYDRDRGVPEEINIKPLGDLSGRSRRSEQTAFIDNDRSIMIATKGFGMGIDKPNIRLIIHRTPTANLEAYAQEAGRAGRDGEISDVVLYYSPDSVKEGNHRARSDYDIQDFFLSEKYIRREDVLAMRGFLSGVQRRVEGHLYFTSDEILPHFDALVSAGSYAWPDFPPRLQRERESPEHAEILELGHLYTEKIGYVDRILSALYRIRPDIGSVKRACLVSSVQETGAVLKCRNPAAVVLNAPAIVNSNAYFGELLRAKGITADKFVEWMARCVNDGTLEFAKFMGLSVADTASMLWDINRSEGRVVEDPWGRERWVPELLDFTFITAPKYGDAEGKNTPTAWRGYAGAAKRASRDNAYESAETARNDGQQRKNNEHGQIIPEDDDWFGQRELTQPKGWEIIPGPALTDTKLFKKYVNAFMELHDRRQANDRAAYNLLLTDYVGVGEDGALPETMEKKSCLRAVLLGYLKTGEVVLGNCRSCSRCAPDGKFERDKAKREEVVERLGTEITDLLDKLENLRAELPSQDALTALWRHVEAQEKLGRSLKAYVGGWTGRLLTDSPGHRAALWTRIDGMVRGFLPLRPKEACSRATKVLNKASEGELPVIWNTVSLFQNVMPDIPEATIVRATACHRLNRFEEEKSLWLGLLEKPTASQVQHNAHAALCRLSASDGPLPDARAFAKHTVEAARSATDFNVAAEFYTMVASRWAWADIRNEILFYQEHDPSGGTADRLLAWWISTQSDMGTLDVRPPPANWAFIVDNAITILKDEARRAPSLQPKLVEAVERWSANRLEKKPQLHTVRALRIALFAAGLTGKPKDVAEESLRYLEDGFTDRIEWLSSLFESGQVPANKPFINIARAEIAFCRGDLASADAVWRSCLNESEAELPEPIADHVLRRLEDIHKPMGAEPDHECFSRALAARARREASWSKAEPLYMKAVDGWSWSQLLSEIRRITEKKDASWPMGLIALWIRQHPAPGESPQILEHLAALKKSLLSANESAVKTILENVEPLALAKHKPFGPERLQSVERSGLFMYEPGKNHHAPAFVHLLVKRGWTASRLKPGFPKEIEFLFCATLTGLIDHATAVKYDVGNLVFFHADDGLATQMRAKYSGICSKQVETGTKSFFFYNYQPESTKALRRWLSWFLQTTSSSRDACNRIEAAIWHVGQLVLTQTRENVQEYLDIFTIHRPADLPEYVSILTEASKVIVAAEHKTSIRTALKLEQSHLDQLERTISTHGNTLRDDVLVSLLRAIMVQTRSSSMVPRLREALIASGRIDEALTASANPKLLVETERVRFAALASQFKGSKRTKPPYDAWLEMLANVFVRTWQFQR